MFMLLPWDISLSRHEFIEIEGELEMGTYKEDI